ncbi:MAG TPA: hypothetical protein DCZ76_07135 [Treponema sp.]|nr:hypothetical protein [Treponema sp.]
MPFLGECSLRRAKGTFFLSCQTISSHGWRVSSVQKGNALLQSFQKSMEGFFGATYAAVEGRGALPAVPCKHIKQGTKPPPQLFGQVHFKRQPVMEPEGGTPKGR